MFTLRLLHLSNETLCGLESGEVVSVNNQCRVLGNITSRLLGAMLDNETAKATKIDVLLV